MHRTPPGAATAWPTLAARAPRRGHTPTRPTEGVRREAGPHPTSDHRSLPSDRSSTVYYSKRPHPIAIAAAGALCAVGVVGIVARALHTFTAFTMVEPIASIAFVIAVVATITGGVLGGLLVFRCILTENRALKVELERLRAEQHSYREILDAVRATDAQSEVTAVRVSKVLDLLRDRFAADQDTQPIVRLHSINGRSGA